jgi:YgiT-type zinc finger domain-containing protein
MASGTTDVTLRRNRSVVVVQSVPAMICQDCGEASLDAKTASAAYDLAQKEIERGVALEFCIFAA